MVVVLYSRIEFECRKLSQADENDTNQQELYTFRAFCLHRRVPSRFPFPMYVFVLPPALFSLQYNDHAQLKYMITFYVVEPLQTESLQADH